MNCCPNTRDSNEFKNWYCISNALSVAIIGYTFHLINTHKRKNKHAIIFQKLNSIQSSAGKTQTRSSLGYNVRFIYTSPTLLFSGVCRPGMKLFRSVAESLILLLSGSSWSFCIIRRRLNTRPIMQKRKCDKN